MKDVSSESKIRFVIVKIAENRRHDIYLRGYLHRMSGEAVVGLEKNYGNRIVSPICARFIKDNIRGAMICCKHKQCILIPGCFRNCLEQFTQRIIGILDTL